MITRTGLALGLLLFIALLVWQGVLEVIGLLLASGWLLLVLPLAWLPSLLPATQAWRLLFIRQRPAFGHAFLAMWMGRAVNNLLPVATIGGEIVKARLVHLWGLRGIDAAASVMADKLIQAISVAIWGLIGVCLLVYLTNHEALALYALLGFLLLSACSIGLFYAQRAGLLGWLATFAGRLIKTESWEGITFNARAVDATIIDIYQHKRRLALAVALRTLALIMQSAELWLACLLLGHPIGLLEALMLKSMTSTLSDIAFMIPNAYGIQEGAYILIGALLGLPAELALAVSLAMRLRDLMLDPAALLVLQRIESRQFSRRQQLRQAAENAAGAVAE